MELVTCAVVLDINLSRVLYNIYGINAELYLAKPVRGSNLQLRYRPPVLEFTKMQQGWLPSIVWASTGINDMLLTGLLEKVETYGRLYQEQKQSTMVSVN